MRVGYNPGVEEPRAHTIVWRYMDFRKLASIFVRKELFFCRADKLDDPYEGRISDFNLRNWMKVYRKEYPNLPKEQLERSRALISGELKEKRHKVIVNCWHMNASESAAMWDSYTKRQYGIAIKTTFRRLSDSLDKANSDAISIGFVKYIDYDKEWMNEGYHIHFPFLYKRKSFEHEKELRAYTELPTVGPQEVIPDIGPPYVEYVKDTTYPKQRTESGKFVSVDVNKLISEIYVSPRAPSSDVDLIKDIAERYGLKRDQVIKSDISSLT
jgi:hypothetical protein